MNKLLYSFLVILALAPLQVAISQNKLAIDDRTGVLTPEDMDLLKDRLSPEGIELVTMVDFTARCDYYFGELRPEDRDMILYLIDCEDRLLGQRNLGGRIHTLQGQDRAFLIAYSISDILTRPDDGTAGKAQAGLQDAGDGEQVTARDWDQMTAPGDPFAEGPLSNEHDTRYFFAPTAFNLRKGELYYNTVYFFLHDIQYGVSDHFSFGMGTTLIGLPVYFTPKLSIPVGEKYAVALGDMLIVGTYGTDAIGNLAYGNFSRRGNSGNISLGGGYLVTNESELTGRTSSGVFNLSGLTQISPYIYLLTENYFFGVNTRQSAWLDIYDEQTGYYDYLSEDFIQNLKLWYGISGFRIISKRSDFVSWQIGLTYLVMLPGPIPSQYRSWQTSAPDKLNLIAFPAVSYTRKFGRKY